MTTTWILLYYSFAVAVQLLYVINTNDQLKYYRFSFMVLQFKECNKLACE